MNSTLLTWIVFILAFGGMVIIHEFGHFIVARWSKVEVEEFGLGLPTPGALTLWVSKGFLILKSGQRIEIPQNFRFPAGWNNLIGQVSKLSIDRVNDRLILRSIKFVYEEEVQAKPKHLELDVYVDPNGKVTQSDTANRTVSRTVIKAGNKNGDVELSEVIAETHPGTRFTLNWLPLGGFVRPKGENDPTVQGGLAAANPWKRFAVLVAGPLMNLLTAVVIYSFIFYRVGVPDVSRVLVNSVVANSPAEEAGFKDGDIFISGNGESIGSFDELRVIVDGNVDQPVTFLVERDGGQIELVATPKFFKDEKRTMIGVGLGVPFKQAGSMIETLNLGARYTYINVRTLLSLPAQMIRGSLEPEQSRLIGLKGIFDIVGQTVSRDVEASANAANAPASTDPANQSFRTLELIAALSISLGIFNLFPFPALDGGRIIFLLPELLFRRRVPAQFENLVHGLGMTVLLLFMIYVNVMDFVNPVNITIP